MRRPNSPWQNSDQQSDPGEDAANGRQLEYGQGQCVLPITEANEVIESDNPKKLIKIDNEQSKLLNVINDNNIGCDWDDSDKEDEDEDASI